MAPTQTTYLTHRLSGTAAVIESDVFKLVAYAMPSVVRGEPVESVMDSIRSTDHRDIRRLTGIDPDHSAASWTFICGRCLHELKSYVERVNELRRAA